MFDKVGVETIFGLILYSIGLIVLYNATQEDLYLSNAIQLWNYIYNLCWDDTYPGINWRADTWDLGKDINGEGSFGYLSYELYVLTGNLTYKEILLKIVKFIKQMP